MNFHRTVKSPVGKLKLIADKTHLLAVLWENDRKGRVKIESRKETKPLSILDRAEKQLNEYFSGQRSDFDLPIRFEGTDFQKKVWKELGRIDSGKLRTYADHAKKVATSKAVRAVGTAIGRNPLSIIIPCHRVIGTTGELTGFAGGLEAKEWLLRHEGHSILNQRIQK
jgi:methylated-DNA-[protein]-cysteine S-methyltransferase